MFFFGLVPTLNVIWLPLFLLLALVTSLGVSLWLAALNVTYRDIGYVIPFFTRTWFFLTPITYASSIVPEAYRTLYGLNPMVGVVEGFRWAMLGVGTPPSAMLIASSVMAVILLVSGA